MITRFAPAPTGYLHLGHVVNALHVWQAADDRDGRVQLRIEDHDRQRARPEYEAAIRAHFAPYTPEWAEALSDVPAATITRIAREFATMGPSVSPIHKKTPSANYANGTETSFA
ncbi:MAG: glutamate--tRNA ligase family protein, partial [Acidobacteriota bacterium]|nr:glutamate--tRNA ligase family protein [Acidobacteriota bacterium]